MTLQLGLTDIHPVGMKTAGQPVRLAIIQPRVARHALPWGIGQHMFSYPEGVVSAVRLKHHGVMSQSLAKILVHTVFSTKDRRPYLRD
jgi:hypothetical protein